MGQGERRMYVTLKYNERKTKVNRLNPKMTRSSLTRATLLYIITYFLKIILYSKTFL